MTILRSFLVGSISIGTIVSSQEYTPMLPKKDARTVARICRVPVQIPSSFTSTTNGRSIWTFGTPKPKQVTLAKDLVREAILVYPIDFIRDIGVRRIILCSDLRENSNPVGSVCWPESNGAFSIALYTSRIPNSHSGRWAYEAAIHHEILHAIASWDTPYLSRTIDSAWRRLSTPESRYGTQQIGSWKNRRFHPELGLVSRYAKTSPREDRAEVFSYLVMSFDELSSACTSDRLLRAKVRAIIAFLRTRMGERKALSFMWHLTRRSKALPRFLSVRPAQK